MFIFILKLCENDNISNFLVMKFLLYPFFFKVNFQILLEPFFIFAAL